MNKDQVKKFALSVLVVVIGVLVAEVGKKQLDKMRTQPPTVSDEV